MKYLENISPREYQQKIFETCKEKNCLVVIPTGIGKTLIALMLTINRIEKYPGEKVLFLAPTKPLAEQHLNYFQKHLPDLFGELTLFTGAINSEKRKKLFQTSDIIFSTPQCIANDVKKNLYDLKEVCLLIEDEAHRCVKNYDYNFIAQKYRTQSNHQRILALTASPGSQKEKVAQICKNLSIQEVEIRTRESDDVKEYLQKLEFQKIPIPFPSEFEEIRQVLKKLYEDYIDELKKRNVLHGIVNKIKLIELQGKIMGAISRGNKNYGYFLAASSCASAIKLQHSIELLETQTLTSFNAYLKELFKQASQGKSKGVQKLVAKQEFNYAYSYSTELLTKGKEHPKLFELIDIIETEKKSNPSAKTIVFTQFRETAKVISKKLNEIENISSKVFVGQAKKSGTGLSQKEQKQIIDDFSEGKINVLVATSIAEEGLDIPEVNAVIFYEAIPSAIRKIQRAGRTARLKPGKLLMLITKNTRDETFYYASKTREKKMGTTIQSIKDELKNGKLEFQKKLN